MIRLLYVAIACVVLGGAHAIAAGVAHSGFYEAIALPTQTEDDSLQRLAQKHGFDFLGALHEMSESNQRSWSKIFLVGMDLKTFNRTAQVYGYHLFTSWLYFVDSVGVEKYALLVNSQPAAVRQRVRDFLYLDAVMAPKSVRNSKERELREKCPSLFPSDYVFGKNDPLFDR